MGSVGSTAKQPERQYTRTEKLVNRISKEIVDWVEDDGYLERDDEGYLEGVNNWHDLLEQLNMEASDAKDYILEALDSDVWDAIRSNKDSSEAMSLQFDGDGEFEDENGKFLKYGQVMKLVKQELVNRKILRKAY